MRQKPVESNVEDGRYLFLVKSLDISLLTFQYYALAER